MNLGIRASQPKVMYTKADVQAMLPQVGDRLERVPPVHGTDRIKQAAAPQPCTVVQVHREHLWYRVQFDLGYSACYKMPGGDS